MVDKLLKQEDADKRFMEFEDRRLKLEEQMEERSQIREQEYDKQMQMMFLQLMQQAMQGIHMLHFPLCQRMRMTFKVSHMC